MPRLFALLLFLPAAISVCSQDIKIIPAYTYDLVYAPVAGRFYASVYEPFGDNHEIAVIEPNFGVIEQRIACPRPCMELALSSDENYLYCVTGIGDSAVMRYNFALGAFDLAFSAGAWKEPFSPQTYPYYIAGIAALPGQPESVALLRYDINSFFQRSIAVYDNGVQRPDTTNGIILPTRMAFGPDASKLYVYNDVTTGFELRVLPVTANGVTNSLSTYRHFLGFGHRIEYAGGRLYGTDGRVVDIGSGAPRLIGTCTLNPNAYSPVEAAPDAAVIYYLQYVGNTVRLSRYDKSNFQLLDHTMLSGLTNVIDLQNFIHWGGNRRLAFTTYGKIIILRDCVSAQPQPPSLPPLLYRVCLGDTLHIAAPGGYDKYYWSNGIHSQESAITQAGNYTYQVADASGCLSKPSEPIVVENAFGASTPEISPDGGQLICAGGFVDLLPSFHNPSWRYIWSTGDTTDVLRVYQPGTYQLRALSEQGCLSGYSQPVTIAAVSAPAPPVPAIALPPDTDTVLCNESVYISAPAGYAAYRWSNGQFAEQIQVWQAGTFRVRVQNGFGCLSEWSPPVQFTAGIVPPQPYIQANGNLLAADQSGEYQWFRDGQAISGATGQFYPASQAGAYTVQRRLGSCWSTMSEAFIIP